jgi:HAD superfamily hydrolase (TIGR01509 family)
MIERYYVERASALAPSPRAVETVLALAARGVAQACVSNSSRAIVDANLDALGIRNILAFSISLDDVLAGKPHPEPFGEAAQRFALPVKTIVAVEDSLAGARSARDAGLYVVGYAPQGSAPIGCDRSIAVLSEILTMFRGQL